MSPNNALRPKAGEEVKQQTSVLDRSVIEARGSGTDDDATVFLRQRQQFSLHSELRSFYTVFTFLTRLPAPHWTDHHPGYLLRGKPYFPLVGGLIGIYVAAFYDALTVFFQLPPVVAAAGSNGASFWLTGCFHEDGLADSGDGFGGGWTKTQIMTIMQDTRLGTYGCAVLMLYVFSKIHLVGALGASHWALGACAGGGPALVVAHVVARCTSAPLMHFYPYLEDTGPKSSYYSFFTNAPLLVTVPRVLATFGVGLACAVGLYGVDGVYVFAAMLVVARLAGGYGTTILGGIMGDFLGATICMTELALLSVLHALPAIKSAAAGAVAAAAQVAVAAHGVGGVPLSVACTDALQALTSGRTASLLRLVAVLAAVWLWSTSIGVKKAWPSDEEVLRDDSAAADASAPVIASSGAAHRYGDVDALLASGTSTFAARHEAAAAVIDGLAKPTGSLGTLEEWGARLCALQRRRDVRIDAVTLVFGGDHGVAKSLADGGEQCSAYPAFVSRVVMDLIEEGTAGICCVAATCGSRLLAFDVGVVGKVVEGEVLRAGSHRLKDGTRNFCKGPAMTADDVDGLLRAGADAVDAARAAGNDVTAVAIGEVGIGNTTAASAVIAALTGLPPTTVAGSGTGLDDAGRARKLDIIQRALTLHADVVRTGDVKAVLAAVGGAEIVAMCGAFLRAHEHGLAAPVCGFIATAAALAAVRLRPAATESMFLATRSAAPGHAVALEAIRRVAVEHGHKPLSPPALDMGLRLGEGTAATLAFPLMRAAAAAMSGMATLDDALSRH